MAANLTILNQIKMLNNRSKKSGKKSQLTTQSAAFEVFYFLTTKS